MPTLTDYREFEGRHWETGTIRNALAYQGVTLPHDGKPLSEALLFGLSGGVVAGYFTFEYAGHDPYLHFITRYSFEPFQMILKRLKLKPGVKQTGDAGKAVEHLRAALAEEKPALVWADVFTLPYNAEVARPDAWAMWPLLVYGYEADAVRIADRARVGLAVTPDELAAARARIASDRHRLMTLGAPDLSDLAGAVDEAIRLCIESLVGEPPRKPMKGKYGLDAYQRWADLLRASRGRECWLKQFAAGGRLYSGLTSAFYYTTILHGAPDDPGSRGQYAAFLREAALILNRPGLKAAADGFERAAAAWKALGAALLPDGVALLKEAREFMVREQTLFRERGGESLDERRALKARREALRKAAESDWPLSEAETRALRESAAESVLAVRDAEREAVMALQAVMG